MRNVAKIAVAAFIAMTGLTGCVTTQNSGQAYNYTRPAVEMNARIENIRVVKTGTSGAGMVTGAVVGGLLGNTIGRGNGNVLATVAGAAAGGYVGNKIEEGQTQEALELSVRFDNGDRAQIMVDRQSSVRVGERIKLYRHYDGKITTSPY